eukprot:gene6505-6732_t
MSATPPNNEQPKLYYKLPPSELVAAANAANDTKVKAKTQSSGIYARCDLGTKPWLADPLKNEATCEATCDALATCWGYIFVPGPGKGDAIRGGEMQLGARTFFTVPHDFSIVNMEWGKPTA